MHIRRTMTPRSRADFAGGTGLRGTPTGEETVARGSASGPGPGAAMRDHVDDGRACPGAVATRAAAGSSGKCRRETVQERGPIG